VSVPTTVNLSKARFNAVLDVLRDAIGERDVLGNLGMALTAQDPRRALELLQLELASARTRLPKSSETSEVCPRDLFAEKTALGHLGIFHLRTRDANAARKCFERALSIAGNLGDRHILASGPLVDHNNSLGTLTGPSTCSGRRGVPAGLFRGGVTLCSAPSPMGHSRLLWPA
jgi:hypothetical protein